MPKEDYIRYIINEIQRVAQVPNLGVQEILVTRDIWDEMGQPETLDGYPVKLDEGQNGWGLHIFRC